ncbi:MAG: methanogenesis marker 14 protein [Methanopyri archaeon]|nr:methanogenesis marker 14 protein [Methanopyri archaeon]
MPLGFLSKLFKKGGRPQVAESEKVTGPQAVAKNYYIVASVELGNTTTKCILTATDLEEGITYLIHKEVRMTRDVRPPRPGEEVFGETVWGVKLTREAVAEMVADVLKEAVRKAHISIDDVHFVVRSTGVTAGFASPEEVGEMIKALADGCLKAGIPPNKMTAAMSKEQIPEPFRKYSLIDKVYFDGAVTGVKPPGGKEVVANEMEGELVMAGIKVGAKSTEVDFRNPCMAIDYGTTLAGRITDDELPYANTIGNLCGLAGAIMDAIVRGTGEVDEETGCALDLPFDEVEPDVGEKAREYAEEVHEFIDIREVPKTAKRFGTVPVDPKAAEKAGLKLIGCDVGENGSDLPKLSEIGREAYEEGGYELLFGVLDWTSALIAKRLIETALDLDLLTEDHAIGITGRAGITGKKPELVYRIIEEEFSDLWNPDEDLVFVDDGLARGAAVMARCMNCLGTPKNPLGGNRGMGCILGLRIKHQQKDKAS